MRSRNDVDNDDEGDDETKHSQEHSRRVVHRNYSNNPSKPEKPKHKDLLRNFKNESDNLERRLNYDLKTLSEIDRTAETMRQYVTNGEMYDDTAVPSPVTVTECLKVKRSARDKHRSLSFTTTPDDDSQYDSLQPSQYNQYPYEHEERSKEHSDRPVTSDFIGENVFLTAEPFEEMEQPEKQSKYEGIIAGKLLYFLPQ